MSLDTISKIADAVVEESYCSGAMHCAEAVLCLLRRGC